MFVKFLNEESGATMVEYGLIGALVSVAAIAVLILMGGGVEDIFNTTTNTLANANY